MLINIKIWNGKTDLRDFLSKQRSSAGISTLSSFTLSYDTMSIRHSHRFMRKRFVRQPFTFCLYWVDVHIGEKGSLVRDYSHSKSMVYHRFTIQHLSTCHSVYDVHITFFVLQSYESRTKRFKRKCECKVWMVRMLMHWVELSCIQPVVMDVVKSLITFPLFI